MCELIELIVTLLSTLRGCFGKMPGLGCFPGLSGHRYRTLPRLRLSGSCLCLSGKQAGRLAFLLCCRAGQSCQPTPLVFLLACSWLFSSHKDYCVGSVFLSQIVIWFSPQNSVPAFRAASLTTQGLVCEGIGFLEHSQRLHSSMQVGGVREASHTHCPTCVRLGPAQQEGIGTLVSGGSQGPLSHMTPTRCHRLGWRPNQSLLLIPSSFSPFPLSWSSVHGQGKLRGNPACAVTPGCKIPRPGCA